MQPTITGGQLHVVSSSSSTSNLSRRYTSRCRCGLIVVSIALILYSLVWIALLSPVGGDVARKWDDDERRASNNHDHGALFSTNTHDVPVTSAATFPGRKEQPAGVSGAPAAALTGSGGSISTRFPRIWPSNMSNVTDDFPQRKSDSTTATTATTRNNTGTVTVYEHDLPLRIRTSSFSSLQSRSQRCKPYSAWHSKSFPTCNVVHEVDFRGGVVHGAYDGDDGDGAAGGGDGAGGVEGGAVGVDDDDSSHVTAGCNEPHFHYLAWGGSRETWRLHTRAPQLAANAGPADYLVRPIVFKNLRYREDYREYKIEHQRIDALATERLTSSDHVVDIYGFCGETALNDFGDGGDLRHYYNNSNSSGNSSGGGGPGASAIPSTRSRLILARDAALAMADIHSIDGPDELTTLVHHDVKPPNFLIVDGRLKVHDFNNAQLLTWDSKKDERCGFRFRSACEHFKKEIDPPKECSGNTKEPMSEKLEVYRLGLILYFILTGIEAGETKSPPSSPEQMTTDDETETVFLTNPPSFPAFVEGENEDDATRAMKGAIERALTYDDGERPSARFIANELVTAAADILAAEDDPDRGNNRLL